MNNRIELALAWADTRRDRIDLLVERDGRFQVVTGTPSADAALPPVPDGWRVVRRMGVPANSGQFKVVVGDGIEVQRLNGFTAWPAARLL